MAILFVVTLISYLTDGVGGEVKYVSEEVDYVGIIKVILSFYLAILFLQLLARAAVRFTASISYCRRQGISLGKLYRMTDGQILAIWGED